MSMVKFSCSISSNNTAIPLGIEIWLNDRCFFDQPHIQQSHLVEYEFSDDDANHELRFVLKNKHPEHTVVNALGEIQEDTRLCIKNIQFDDLDCQLLTYQLAEYRHNFNGTGKDTQERFYGELGCNGTVTLKFTTPIYIWLLENL